MEITVTDDTCWICGRHTNIVKFMTSHHTLPKHLNPKKNFVCPVCQDCHDKLNQDDHAGLVKFAFKIDQTFKELAKMVFNMTHNLRRKGENK